MNKAAIAVCLAAMLSLCGCQQKQKVAADPETQKELDELDKFLEQRAATSSRDLQKAKVVPASTNFAGGSPASELDLDLQSGSAEKMASRLDKFASPEDVCEAFLDALDQGEHVIANQMLTNVAQLETARANLELESPGIPGASFEIQPAKYATSAQKVAQVASILRQPDAPPIRLTWMMRRQYNGWKISGMSIPLDSDGANDFLSFENPKDLARIQQTVAEDAGDIPAIPPGTTVTKLSDETVER